MPFVLFVVQDDASVLDDHLGLRMKRKVKEGVVIGAPGFPDELE